MYNMEKVLESDRTRIAVIAGARSTEHEVSLVSAYNIAKAINRDKYEVFIVGISKSGEWRQYSEDDFVLNPDSVGTVKLSDNPISGRLAVTQCSRKFYDIDNNRVAFECDVVFPAVLGNYAEDGTMQGLLRMMDVPFATPDVLGSAVGMDKDVSYRLMRDAGIDIADFVVVRASDDIEIPLFSELKSRFDTETMFVKPSNAGSSVGVTKVTSQEELERAIEHAFHYDVKVIIQAGIIGRELEIAVIGNIGSQKASIAGEISQVNESDFYNYGNKYINSDKTSKLEIPAQLPEDILNKIRATAIKVCEVLECEGFSRVDFFLTKENKIVVNEINTMPGFTYISMFPKLWVASGLSYPELVDKILDYAMDRYIYRVEPMILDAADILENIKRTD